MRTIFFILAGLVLLGVALVCARWFGDPTKAPVIVVKAFLVAWFVVAAINMWIGVARAGYSVIEELPIFLIIYLVPAGVAGLVWWRFLR